MHLEIGGIKNGDSHLFSRRVLFSDALAFGKEVTVPVFAASTIFAVYNRLPGPKEYRVYPRAGHSLGGTNHETEKRAWLQRQFTRAN